MSLAHPEDPPVTSAKLIAILRCQTETIDLLHGEIFKITRERNALFYAAVGVIEWFDDGGEFAIGPLRAAVKMAEEKNYEPLRTLRRLCR